MSESEQDERGRFVQKHTDDDVLAAVRKHEPAATNGVATELGIEPRLPFVDIGPFSR
jgi:hypothetical protein